MIEDALKSTRTLHRLIMTVSLVTIVFALSISLPEDKAAQKQIIDDLIATDFASYKVFVDAKVEEQRQADLVPLSQTFRAELESKGHLIFGLNNLAEELGKPIHIGRLLTEDLLFAEISSASLTAMNALNGLSLGADVQILIPRTEELLTEIDAFLSEHPQAGRRVDTIRITLGDFDFTAESFLPGEEVTVGIYFELLDAVRTGGAPTFNANFVADISEIAETAFLTWLQTQGLNEALVKIDGDEVIFASGLQGVPQGFATEKLGVLSLRLADEIARSSPASQSVSILGTNIPGALAIFASPIILFALAYYFAAHTGHLTRIVGKDRDSFEAFSWLPISIQAKWTFKTSHRLTFILPFGVLECLSSAVILPLGSMGLLYYRLQSFGNLTTVQVLWLVGAGLGIIIFGLLTCRNIMMVRSILAEPEDLPTDNT